MKKFNKDSPLARLQIKRKLLTTEVGNLKRELVSETGTERKKRALLKQINTIEINIREVNELIRKERSDSIKQYTKTDEIMLRTPTKNLNATFDKTDTQTDRQPTKSNTDPDIIERNIPVETQKTTLPEKLSGNIPSVTYTIPISAANERIDPLISNKNIQAEMNRSKSDSNNLNSHSNLTLKTINEKPTGTIPKLKRSSRVLDFSRMNLTDDNNDNEHTFDHFELPKTRGNNYPSDWPHPILSQPPQNLPYTFTQTNIFPKTSVQQDKTQFQHSQYPITINDTRDYSRGQQIRVNDLQDSNLASNYPDQNKSQTQYSQVTKTIDDLHLPKQSHFSNTETDADIDFGAKNDLNIYSKTHQYQADNLESSDLASNYPNQNRSQTQYSRATKIIDDLRLPKQSYVQNIESKADMDFDTENDLNNYSKAQQYQADDLRSSDLAGNYPSQNKSQTQYSRATRIIDDLRLPMQNMNMIDSREYPTNKVSQRQSVLRTNYSQFPILYTDTHFPLQEETLQNIATNINANRSTENRSQDRSQNQRVQTHNFNDNLNRIEQTHTISPRITFLRRLKAIPIFRGETYVELRDFIDIVDTLYVSISSQPEEAEFYDQLILQIRGEARNAIEQLEQTNWRTIREKLRDHFSYLANREIVNSKLENLRQERNESLNAFADRTRKILREKNNMYNGLSEDQKLEYNRIARRAFAKGIADPKLRNRLLIRGANSLEDAIAYSIEAETDLMQEISNRELTCTYCKLMGHRERDCRKKELGNSNGDLNNLISALQVLNIRENNERRNSPLLNRQRRYNNNAYGNDRPFNRNLNYNNNLNRNWNGLNNYARNYDNQNFNSYARNNNNQNPNNFMRNNNYPNRDNEYKRIEYNQNDRNGQQRNANQNPRGYENRNNSPSLPIRNFYFDLDSENSSDTSWETNESQTYDSQTEN